ncbi:Cryparin [Cladobotryum mycophilum]|uniref:Cryparin n=1 Tax=Cladobotryum mycophilum TaxID=491253 RepID=A0ABR0SNK8_9HYPO
MEIFSSSVSPASIIYNNNHHSASHSIIQLPQATNTFYNPIYSLQTPPESYFPSQSPNLPFYTTANMQFLATAALFLSSLAVALPTTLEVRDDKPPCTPGFLYGSPQCCATDVAGVADLDCETLPKTPDAGNTFNSICTARAKQPKCCSLPFLGLGLLCQDPVAKGM